MRRQTAPPDLRRSGSSPLKTWRPRFDLIFPLAYAGVYFALGIALHLRLFPIGSVNMESDFYGDMVCAAQKLARGEFSVHNYPYKGPFYSVLLVLLHTLVRDWYRSGVLLNLLSAGGALIVTYRLLLSLFNRPVAVLGMTLSSLVVDFFLHSHRATSDLLFLFLALASTYLVCTGRSSPRRYAAAGALAALAFLTRMNGAFLPVATVSAILLVNPRFETRTARARAVVLYLAVFVLCCSPWWWMSLRETGQLVATKNLQNLTAGLYPISRFASAPLDSLTSVAAVLRYDPGQCVTQYLANLPGHYKADMQNLLGFPGALLALLGLAGVILGAATRAQWAFYVFAVVHAALMGPFFYASRFSFPLVAPYFGSGLAMLLTPTLASRLDVLRLRFARRRPATAPRASARSVAWRRGGSAFLAVFFPVLVGVQLYRIFQAENALLRDRPLYILEAAKSLREYAKRNGGSLLMARKGHLALHAGMDYLPYPVAASATLDDLLRFAHEHRVDYLAYGVPEFQLVPRLRFLASLDSIPGLRFVYRDPLLRVFATTSRTNLPIISPQARREFLEANVQASLGQGDPWYTSRAYDELGVLLLDQGDGPGAKQALQQAILVADPGAARDPLLERNACSARHHLAAVHFTLGAPGESIPLLERNLASYAHIGNSMDLATTRQLLGMCRQALGQEQEARIQFAQACDLYLRAGARARADSLRASLESEPAPAVGTRERDEHPAPTPQ